LPLEVAKTLRHLAEEIEKKPAAGLGRPGAPPHVLEEKLFAMLLASTPDEEIVTVRAEADRDLLPTAGRCRRADRPTAEANTFTSACWRNLASAAELCFTCKCSASSLEKGTTSVVP